ncbi:MAG: 3-deoxy-manno-octulosonate cytidylyltransferase [Candidatus Riflebacteria bacterium HGW-Riflebacteria-2]|jgi:3-deoxy-manno-octulosonate cytidylyltransferase (CMP-KDO synthetase)|nr:MAG: 3-deoxy-manno-octulosonate cytidylyltransferase [Candidatus Riflebacteria bacterium HGW-Riflebacteria-2]
MTDKRNYSVIGVVPARLASTRLPEKMLADLAGTPLVAMTARSAMASGAFDEVVVATDSQKIVEAVEKSGFKAYLTDPELPSGTARVAEVARQTDADVYVNIQGDEPLIDGEGLRRVAQAFADPGVKMATLWFPLLPEDEGNPNAVKLVVDCNDDAIYFSRSIIPFPRSYERFAPRKHLGVYGYRRETLLQLTSLAACDLEKVESLEQLRALYHGIKIRVLPAARDSIGVDTHADLERVREELRRRKAK